MRYDNPFRDAPAWRDWLLAGVLVAVLGTLGLWALGGLTRHGDLSNLFEPASTSATREPVTDPPPIEATASLPGTAQTTVFVCERSGVRTYSDRDCGPNSRTTVIDGGRLNTYTAPAAERAATGTPVPTAAPAATAQAAPATAKPEAACRSLEQQVEQIDARMRAGYRSQEGEWLRARRLELKERHHAIGCTWRDP